MKKILFMFTAIIVLTTTILGGCAAPQGTGTQPPAESPAAGGASEPADSPSSGGASSSQDPIKFGIFEPLTGTNAAYGEYATRGATIANEMFPEALGRPIELVFADNKSDAVEASVAASRLVEKDKVNVVLGSNLSVLCMAGGPAFEAAKTPAIAATATNVNVTLGNDYYYRVCFLDPFQVRALASYAYRDLGMRRLAVLFDLTSDGSIAAKDYLLKDFPALGGEVVAEMSCTLGDQDYSSQVITMMAADPDIFVCITSVNEAALALKQLRMMGYDTPAFGTDGLDVPEYISIGKEDVEGARCTTFFDHEAPITEMTTKFVDLYREKYGEEPAAPAALAFDTYLAAYYAIIKANSAEGPAIKAALDELVFDGCTGAGLSFDENGDAIKDSIVIKIVRDGQWRFDAVYQD